MYHQPEKRPTVAIATLIGWCTVAVLHCHVAHANLYNVGEDKGWDYGVVNWTKGINFTSSDVLHFSYLPGEHNVVIVNQQIFEKCFDPNDKSMYPTYDSGSDLIGLSQGYNYFASRFPRDCEGGIKLAVYAN